MAGRAGITLLSSVRPREGGMGARLRRGSILVVVGSMLVLNGVAAPAGAAPRAADPVTGPAAAAAKVPSLWARHYNGGGSRVNAAVSAGVSPDGQTVFVTGGSSGPSSVSDFATVAYDTATGAERWVARYDGGAGGNDYAMALKTSPDGSTVFVTGASMGTDDLDYATVAYDAATGAERWVARYDGPGGGAEYVAAIGVSPDGSTVFVTGESYGSGTGYDYATVGYDVATGAERWVARYNGGGDDGALDLAVSPDGSTVFVTGFSGTTDPDFATVAYDATSGASGWVERYRGPGASNDLGRRVAVSPDGSRVFVTGQGGTGFATLAYDSATGSQLWLSRYSGPGGLDTPTALGVRPDGSMVYVSGVSYGSNSGADFATAAYDPATGELRWAARLARPETDQATALAVTPDGSLLFVTGSISFRPGHGDYLAVAYRIA